jgi:acetoin utilization deacetylase AcuC-like enzyme
MRKLNVVYNHNYDIPLPDGHRFVGTKFSDLYNHIKDSDIYKNLIIHKSIEAPISDVQCVHKSEYVLNVKQGSLSRADERKINLPWSKRLARRSFLAIQGTLQTSQLALGNGVACHLAGGTHHAFKDCGSGFCVFNDLAYASIALLNQKKVKKILILDLDVHQGDGTASICENIDNIFTCSIHCKNNFPFDKKNSNLDVPIDDEVNDVEYINILIKTLDQIESNFTPDIVFYDAGVDVHSNDDLGNLNLTDYGIKKRDEIVCEYFKEKKIPLCTVIGGGYSKNRQELASRHFSIFETVSKTYL